MLIAPLVNFTIAYIVIQQSGQAVWGQFVETLIFISLATMIIAFGIKDHVLREASLYPGQLGALVKSGLLVRSLLVIPGILIGAIVFPLEYLGWFACWLMAMLIYSGINPIVNFNRGYKEAIVAELLFAGFLISYFLIVSPDLIGLIIAFSMAAVLRSSLLLILFRRPLATGKATFNWKLLALGLPFLAMGFTGMLQSKTDLYLVAAILGDMDLAVYQVTINFFVYLQALSGLILLPFAKNLIRVPERVVWKVSFRFALMAVLLLTITLPIIYWVLNHLYGFELGIEVILIGGLFVLPSFIYAPIVYKLIGNKRESVVLYINLLGVLTNFVFSYLFLLRLGIIGALIGTMISQGSLLILYILVLKIKPKSKATM